jgi:hypothetical protein
MMHTKLASNRPETHALIRQHQSLSLSNMITLRRNGLRREVQLTGPAAKTLTSSAILPAF